MQLLCAFARHPTRDERVETKPDREEEPRLRQDVQAVMTVDQRLSREATRTRKKGEVRVGSAGCLSMPGADLFRSISSAARRSDAQTLRQISSARICPVQRSTTRIYRARSSGTRICLALTPTARTCPARRSPGQVFPARRSTSANLSSASFSPGTTGLTQDQLRSGQRRSSTIHPNLTASLTSRPASCCSGAGNRSTRRNSLFAII